MTTVTVFRRKVHVAAQRPLLTILRQIKNGLYRQLVEEVRHQLLIDKKHRAFYFRDLIPEFTPSACFGQTRQLEYLEAYSQFIQLEVKNVAKEELCNIKFTATQLPHTFACFVNTEGNGLIILTRTPLDPRWHRFSFLEIRKYYLSKLKARIGKQGHSILDLCRYSYDPDMYLNTEAPQFPVQPGPNDVPPRYSNLERALEKTKLITNH